MREWSYPVLNNGNEAAVTNKEKASLLVNTFVTVQSYKNCLRREEEGERRLNLKTWIALRMNTRSHGRTPECAGTHLNLIFFPLD